MNTSSAANIESTPVSSVGSRKTWAQPTIESLDVNRDTAKTVLGESATPIWSPFGS